MQPTDNLLTARRPSAPERSARRGASAIPLGTAAVYAVLVAVVVERITAVTADLQLWADGAWFLVRIASTRNYYLWVGDWKRELFRSRLFTILCEQTPLVLATHLRIHSLHALSLIFGATLYAHALASLYLCYRYAAKRWYMLFPLLSFFAGTMSVEAYLSTDSHFLVSLYWPILFILLFREELSRWTLVLLLALSVPTILSYESMMFYGMVLAGVCIWRVRRLPRQRGLMLGLAAWYVAGACLALAAVIWPFDPTNRSGFLHALLFLIQSNDIAAKVSLVVLACCTLLLAIPSSSAILRRVTAAVGFVAIAYLWFEVIVGRTPTSLEVEVPARVFNLLMPLAATVLLIVVLSGWSRPSRQTIRLLALLIAGLGFGQVFWNMAAIMRWQGMLATLRYELLLHEGPVAFEDSIMAKEQLGPLHLRELHAHWPLLPLSLYETGKGEVRSIILPESGTYFPFDPFAPDTMPDLSRYGVHYNFYREALKRTWRYHLGDTLTFTRGGSGAQFMRGVWCDAEPWATWSCGADFGIDLPLPEKDLPDSVLLRATVSPYLSPKHTDSSIDVFVNGAAVGRWNFHYPSDGIVERTVEIPKEVLVRSAPAQIRFRIDGTLLSPAELGSGSDPRKLGLAFLKLTLTPAK